MNTPSVWAQKSSPLTPTSVHCGKVPSNDRLYITWWQLIWQKSSQSLFAFTYSMGPTNLAKKRSEPMCFFETYITCECECASRQNGNWKYKQGLKPKLYYPHLVKRQIEQTKSSLGPKEKSVVPEPLFEHHTFATPVREILQLPKTTRKNLHPPMKPRGKQ